MRLNRLSLNCFRNFSQLSVDLSNYSQIALVGDNAQGKSNFLESLFILAFASSYRTQKIAEVISWDEDITSVQAVFTNEHESLLDVSFAMQRNGKRQFRINHEYQRRLQDCVGKVKLVFFSSRDMQMIIGAPGERRRFLDMLMTQAYPRYYPVLQAYMRVLKQRNSLLKRIKEFSTHRPAAQVLDQLDSWDIQLSQYGSFLVQKRLEGIRQLRTFLEQVHADISNSTAEISLQYQSSIEDYTEEKGLQAQFLKTLKKMQNQEIRRGQTLVGPHRDDLSFMLAGHDLRLFGSQGQMRTLVLSLKMSELLYLSKCLEETPLLLLDDVFSELDLQRQQYLLKVMDFPNVQTFLTTTHLNDHLQHFLKEKSVVFKVEQGKLHT